MKLTKTQTKVLEAVRKCGRYTTGWGTSRRPLGYRTHAYGMREADAIRALAKRGLVRVEYVNSKHSDGTWTTTATVVLVAKEDV